MKLRDLSRRIREEDRPDISFALQGGMELSDINTDWLADFPETVYIANSQSVIFGKVQKETLLYLIARQREFQFRQILDSMNDGVIAVDETGRIFYANPAYVSILGVPLRRIMGKRIQSIEPTSLLSQTVEKKIPLTSEKQIIPSIKKYVSLRAVPLWDGETFLGAVSIFQDVTKLHRLGQEVQQMSDIVDEYSHRIRSQEIAEKMRITSYNKAFQTLIQKVATVALTDVPMLIQGESGTGKSAMAYYLHQCSGRREKPFLVMNCAAIPQNMMESELFGDNERPGKLMLADGGTLFLDEVEELTLPAQSRLLHYIGQNRDNNIGERTAALPDTRIIASAGQALEPLVDTKHFRRELFFQLSTIAVTLPPLRERRDDIIPLANQFLSDYNEKYHRDVMFSSQVYQDLQKYDWPGNLQELKSYVERVVILSDNGLPIIELSCDQKDAQAEGAEDDWKKLRDRPLAEQMQEFEQRVIRETLKACGGNRTEAMRRLGLSRRTFYRKCEKLEGPPSAKK